LAPRVGLNFSEPGQPLMQCRSGLKYARVRSRLISIHLLLIVLNGQPEEIYSWVCPPASFDLSKEMVWTTLEQQSSSTDRVWAVNALLVEDWLGKQKLGKMADGESTIRWTIKDEMSVLWKIIRRIGMVLFEIKQLLFYIATWTNLMSCSIIFYILAERERLSQNYEHIVVRRLNVNK